MKRNSQQAQLAFDFSFNETVAAIDRINEDAAADPVDEQNSSLKADLSAIPPLCPRRNGGTRLRLFMTCVSRCAFRGSRS